MKYKNWIQPLNPVLSVTYDLHLPPQTPLIGTLTYEGPPLSVCGNPDLLIQSAA